jgi:selenocysteine lyase/cysteine desulfurase
MGVIERVGVGAIETHVRGLVARLLGGLEQLDARVTTPLGDGEYGPLVCVASTDPEGLVRALADERIVTSSRDASLRISLHLYNVEEDVDEILRALAKHRHLLVP